jgi:alkylhydroperoxidase/carboxymuconolactone decarboxylase family protein YurZ
MTDATPQDELEEHWVRTLGAVPELMATLRRMNEEYFASYTRMRRQLLEERPGRLSNGAREIAYVVIDVMRDNLPGAKNHARAALKAGVTKDQIAELITILLLTTGMVTFGKVGKELWEFVEAERDD